jgi:hypothetical protein
MSDTQAACATFAAVLFCAACVILAVWLGGRGR